MKTKTYTSGIYYTKDTGEGRLTLSEKINKWHELKHLFFKTEFAPVERKKNKQERQKNEKN